MFGDPMAQIDELLKQIQDLQKGRVMAHADGSVNKENK